LPLQGSYLNPGQITNKSPSARRARPRNIKFLQAILTAHHLSNIQTIAKMSEEADAPSAMALALENSSVSYEDLADIEKEFDDAETEISKFESHACDILKEYFQAFCSHFPDANRIPFLYSSQTRELSISNKYF
jgi:hypothetical protein